MVAVEANITCPNLEDRQPHVRPLERASGAAIGAAVAGLAGSLPLWAKLSPNVTDLPELAAAALEAGADGVTLINTVMGLALDPATGRARLGAGGGGLSGPAIHPVAVRAVYECRAAFPRRADRRGGRRDRRGRRRLSCWRPAPTPCRWAPPPSPTRGRPAGSLAELAAWCASHGIVDH